MPKNGFALLRGGGGGGGGRITCGPGGPLGVPRVRLLARLPPRASEIEPASQEILCGDRSAICMFHGSDSDICIVPITPPSCIAGCMSL